MACSYKQVTIYTKLFTIAIWMEVSNSHLLSSSLRGWLLATGKGRRKSATKSGSASNHCGVWTWCLKAEVGGAVHSGNPGRISRLTDSDVLGSCSCLTARPSCTRVWHGALNDIFGASMDKAVWSMAADDTIGGRSFSSPKVCPKMPKFKSSRRSIIRSC